jgi:hypothetical protein
MLFLKRKGAALVVLSLGAILLSLLTLTLSRRMKRDKRRRDLWRLLRQKQGVIHATLHASREHLERASHFNELFKAAQTTGDRLAAMIVERSRTLHSAALCEDASAPPFILDKQALLGDPQPQEIVLVDLLEEVCVLVAPLCWENNTELRIHSTAPSSVVWADAVMVRMILANFVEQRVHNLPRGSPLILTVKRARENIRLQIVDSGYQLGNLTADPPLPQHAFSLSAPELDILCFKAGITVQQQLTQNGEHRLTLKIPRPLDHKTASDKPLAPDGFSSTNIITFPQEGR